MLPGVLECAGDFPVCRQGWGKLVDEVAEGHPHLFLFVDRLLAEEEEKLKQLMKLKEEQEEYIIKTQREKQVLKQEMESKNKCLEEAQKQLEEVRVNRQRVDQDVMVSVTSVPHPSCCKPWGTSQPSLSHLPTLEDPAALGAKLALPRGFAELCHARARGHSVAEKGQVCPGPGGQHWCPERCWWWERVEGGGLEEEQT